MTQQYQRRQNTPQDWLGIVLHHPTLYGAWDAAVRLSSIDCNEIKEQLYDGLHARDPFTRECCLEVLATQQDPLIIAELAGVFNGDAAPLTESVSSLSRLRSVPVVTPTSIEAEERLRSTHRRKTAWCPYDIVNAIPNIVLPESRVTDIERYLNHACSNPNYMNGLSAEDIKDVHFLFYTEDANVINREFRTQRLWSCGSEGSMIEPYGQSFVVPSAIPQLMSSIAQEYRTPLNGPALATAATLFFRHNIIHPFYDGNGRTNFTLMNLLLDARGMHHITMLDEDLPGYYAALNASTPDAILHAFTKMAMRDV